MLTLYQFTVIANTVPLHGHCIHCSSSLSLLTLYKFIVIAYAGLVHDHCLHCTISRSLPASDQRHCLTVPDHGHYLHCTSSRSLLTLYQFTFIAVHCTRSISNQLSRLVGKPTMWFPNRSDTNRPVQAQKRATSLKFRI